MLSYKYLTNYCVLLLLSSLCSLRTKIFKRSNVFSENALIVTMKWERDSILKKNFPSKKGIL